MTDAIPKDTAIKLCEGIRKENRGKWYSFYGVWCYMCNKVSKGNVTKLCFNSSSDNRGCSQVSKRYDTIKS